MFAIKRRSSPRSKGCNDNQFIFELNNYLKHISSVPRNVSDSRAFNSSYIEVISKPFKAFKIKNFFRNSVAKALYDEIYNLHYELKKNDLFSLYQSQDLVSYPHESPLFSLREFFDIQVRKVMQVIFQKRLDKALSISVSNYSNTCHLLCHDDKYADRDVAFIYYINQKWDVDNGGLFEMFSHDKYGRPTEVEETICPVFNTFLCFEVSSASFHQVSEVVTSQSEFRYAISGWFHSSSVQPKSAPFRKTLLPSELSKRVPLVRSDVHDIGLLINLGPEHFLKNSEECLLKFSEEKVIMLNSFVADGLYEDMTSELLALNQINWVRQGPPNIRNVEIAVLNYDSEMGLVDGCPALSAFLDTVQTSPFVYFLYSLLGLDFNAMVEIEIEMEINRWSWKTYTLAHVNENEDFTDSIELWLFFNTNCIREGFENGTTGVLYNFNEFDEFIAPVDNTLVILDRPPGIDSLYLKYVNNKLKDSVFYSLRVRFFITNIK